jgi:hypothetical protein
MYYYDNDSAMAHVRTIVNIFDSGFRDATAGMARYALERRLGGAGAASGRAQASYQLLICRYNALAERHNNLLQSLNAERAESARLRSRLNTASKANGKDKS